MPFRKLRQETLSSNPNQLYIVLHKSMFNSHQEFTNFAVILQQTHKI
jgi:hypothetical protein